MKALCSLDVVNIYTHRKAVCEPMLFLTVLTCSVVWPVGGRPPSSPISCSSKSLTPFYEGHLRATQCPKGPIFQSITKVQDIPPTTEAWIMLQNRDYSIGSISPDDDARAKRMVQLLKSPGYVYLFNHSIPDDSVEDLFTQSLHFFELPTESEKETFLRNNIPGFKPISIRDVKIRKDEIVNNRNEVLSDDSVPFQLRDTLELLQYSVPGSNVSSIPYAYPALAWLRKESYRVAREVLQLIAMGLGLESVNAFVDMTQGFDNESVKTMSRLTTVIYHGAEKNEILPGNPSFIGSHNDFGLISFIYQDHVGELEVANQNGDWNPVDPIPGSIILIAASMMRILSSGEITPAFHQVAPPLTQALPDGTHKVIKGRPQRQSVIHFICPDDEVWLRPLKNADLTTKDYFVNLMKGQRSY